VYLFFTQADTLGIFALLMAVSGFVSPIYRVGVDAMVADLIPQEKRIDAYALLRMSHNLGVAIGPSIGGFLATRSYNIIFACAAAGLFLFSLLTVLFVKETRPAEPETGTKVKEKFGGYGKVLKDKVFMAISTGFTINTIGASMVFVLLAVYAKEQFGVPENQFGFIMASNAALVVLFQVLVTRFSKNFPPYRVMALGSFFYCLGIGSVALGSGFLGFLVSMVIMTIGELLLVPTTTTQVANLAPKEMRGRYMSIYGLSWGVASGIGPVFGGFLSDTISPRATWYGGALIGLVSVAVFVLLALYRRNTLAQA
jgi:MFS family permease